MMAVVAVVVVGSYPVQVSVVRDANFHPGRPGVVVQPLYIRRPEKPVKGGRCGAAGPCSAQDGPMMAVVAVVVVGSYPLQVSVSPGGVRGQGVAFIVVVVGGTPSKSAWSATAAFSQADPVS